MHTRREFLQTNLAAAAPQAAGVPWYRRTYRWGQTNITEKDPVRYDIPFWRRYWKETRVQGVIINAGGIVAYYPSRFPLQHRAEFLNGRDLFGELARAAHEDGLVVLARMDSNRAGEDFYRRHPDWFCVDANGAPYRAADKYVSCVNSPYYDEYLPGILREIIERSHPEGFADNSWSGLSRDSICYCENCSRAFRARTGQPIPRRADWNDPVYRQWIRWNYDRRLEIWDLNNRATKSAGGPHCLWIGMNSGSIANQARQFRDYREICRRAEMILLDHQSRSDAGGFQQNAEMGKLIHGILGWDKLVPESMALYQAGRTSFRLASKPADEARQWMVAGFAGGIQPWWHHIGAYHEDRRMYRTAAPVMRWHEEHEQYLVNRRPVAAVGVVWSQQNTDFYGRGQAEELTELPYRGMVQALVRARIPYVPLNIEDIASARVPVLALPNVAALSDAQCAAIRQFVARGGSLVATGSTSLFTEEGDPRPDFGLAGLFGAHRTGTPDTPERQAAGRSFHSYLRLAEGPRHAVLRGFDDTAILPYGGMLEPLRIDSDAAVLLTFIPPFPIYPPETAWMRVERTDVPALVLRGRVAYLPADLDRRYAKDNLPDHANLLANIFRWAIGGRMPLAVNGPALIDTHLYEQPGRLVLHLVNLTNSATWRAPMGELLPIGPFQVTVPLPGGIAGRSVRLLVSGRQAMATRAGNTVRFEVDRIADHEVAVIA